MALFTLPQMIQRLTRGFVKVTGRKPDGLEKIKIKQEALERIKQQDKVVDMEGNVIDTSKGIIGGKQAKAMGGRIGYKDGPDQPGRRKFMKIMGGLATIPLIGKYFKVGKAATEVATEAVKQSTPPPYFFELAQMIKKFGKPDKVTYSDRVEIHRMLSKDGKSELQLTEDLSTGNVQIKKIKPEEDMVNEDIVLEYRKGDVDVDPEAGTAFKEADEYTEGREVTQRIYKDNYNEPDFYEGEGIEEIIKEIKDTPSIKKAGGGIAKMLGE